MTAADCVSPGRDPAHPQSRASRKGVALVVVLAFVVLLTGIIVAFLTRALSQKQIATSSANQTTAELFAQGALDTVVGDLKTEITTLSTATQVTTGSSTLSLYSPSTATAATPALAASTGKDGLENLLKISKYNTAFFPPSGPARAANLPTGAASLNGRFISPERWNAPLLVAKKDPLTTATTPVANFPLPDWVLVARDGSNPTGTLPGTAKWSPSDPKTVIGRYAYAIYNEGGLLDINSAGYPSGLTAAETGSKMALAFADLTQINPDPATQTYLNQREIDAIVGWRNYASAQPPGAFPNPGFLSDSRIPNASTNFYNFIRLTPNGIIPPANTTLFNGQSDRTFSSRQQLLTFLSALGETSTPSRRANLQNAAQYLGTFSRALNQPSFRPDPNRPKVVGPGYTGGTTYSGGNSAYGLDDLVNPAFRSIRVSASFPRNNGSQAVPGEPLVKTRFALNRLCWITCQGPSAGATATVRDAYLNQGVPAALLDQGTAANIYKYFGLTWTPGLGVEGIGGYWTYEHGFPNLIAPLETLAKSPNAREADFFEVLKAALCAGSLAKGSNTCVTPPYNSTLGGWNARTFTRIDNHVIQIAANIIDQASPDNFPTRLVFADTTCTNSFFGVVDLPYLHNNTDSNIITRWSSLPITGTLYEEGPEPVQVPPNGDYGEFAVLVVPTVWNPHRPNTNVAFPAGLSPQNLRISISTKTPLRTGGHSDPLFRPQHIYRARKPARDPTTGQPVLNPDGTTKYTYSDEKLNNNAALVSASWNLGNFDAGSGILTPPGAGAPGNTALLFDYDSTLYRQPTPLVRFGLPVGSNLRPDVGNAIATLGNSAWNDGIPEVGSLNKYVGFYVGKFPVRWPAVLPSEGDRVAAGQTALCTSTRTATDSDPSGETITLEFKSGSAWIPYSLAYTHQGRSRDQGMVVRNTDAERANHLQSAIVRRGAFTTMSWDCRSQMWMPQGNYYPGDYLDEPSPVSDLFKGRTVTETYRPHKLEGQASHGVYFGAASQDMNNARFFGSPGLITNAAGHIMDSDGIVRRAMGAHVPVVMPRPRPQYAHLPVTQATTTIGLPLATATDSAGRFLPAGINASNRPILLNRPFRTVAELGCVFSGVPWRNLDFSTPESGSAALLDAFCIHENPSPDPIAAGRVDLNTRQAPVLKALLASAGRDELATGNVLTATEVDNIARALVSRTTDTAILGRGPLSNIAELVGRYGAGFKNGAATDASQPYDGFSKDLGGLFTGGAESANNLVSRLRESALRAFSETGQAGTWNLLIDLVAQVGRYPASAVNAQDFLVEGEKRYWLHVAIDRQTAQVIAQQTEPVTE